MSIIANTNPLARLLAGEGVKQACVCPHWWGVYKFEIAERRTKAPMPLEDVDILFYETFHPDSFHLGAAEIRPEFHDPRQDERARLLEEVRRLEDPAAVSRFVQMCRYTPREVREAGVYAHVERIAQRYHGQAFIVMNEGNSICDILNPGGIIGFEEGLVALLEKPDLMRELILGLYQARLDWVRQLRSFGCHAYMGSETYASADVMSPAVYERLVFPAQQFFYSAVREAGLVPIVYFLGDVNPLIDYINELGVAALLVEESKKRFELDVVEIRKRLSPGITLFGNIDSVHTLLHSNEQDVRRAVREQMRAAEHGRFVVANGSPIAPGTPERNVHAMIEEARK